MKNPYWIILADTQLGAIHWQNPTRENDYYQAFQTQCQKAADDSNCLGILGLGDLRERASLQAKNLGGLNRGLRLLSQANKPLLALMGNHDFTVPNWIEEMCYPSLKNLTNPEVQEHFGFNPDTTLALDFTPKSQLTSKIAGHNPENLELIFLHQSLKELTTQLKQSYDFCLNDLETLGVGKSKECLVFLGDLHNYGDTKQRNITAAYPGSLEMTDINEGTNGLKSLRIPSGPHDYRKFVIHFYPETKTWEPVETTPRPWMRLKATTTRETKTNLRRLQEEIQHWTQPGCLLFTAPKTELETLRKEIKPLPLLEARIEEYIAEEEPESSEHETQTPSLSWTENKKELDALGAKQLDTEALSLLHSILQSDGATHNTKHDILTAWSSWFIQTEDEHPNTKPPSENPASTPSEPSMETTPKSRRKATQNT